MEKIPRVYVTIPNEGPQPIVRELILQIIDQKCPHLIPLAFDNGLQCNEYHRHVCEKDPERKPKLVIVNYTLYDRRDGSELTMLLKQNDSKIIVAGISGRKGSMENMLTAGVDLFMPKPWGLPDLEYALDKVYNN